MNIEYRFNKSKLYYCVKVNQNKHFLLNFITSSLFIKKGYAGCLVKLLSNCFFLVKTNKL